MQYCGSGMLIPDPDVYLSRIPNPTTTKEKGQKIVVLWYLFVTTHFTNLKMSLFLNRFRIFFAN
jgi:hypothetical protein